MSKKIIYLCALIMSTYAWSSYRRVVPQCPEEVLRYFKTTPSWNSTLQMYIGTGHDNKPLGFYHDQGSWAWAIKGKQHAQFQPMALGERPVSPMHVASCGTPGDEKIYLQSRVIRRRRLQWIRITKWVVGLTAGAWLIKKAWNYVSKSTQEEAIALLTNAEKFLQIITPAYAALFTADDTTFAQILTQNENYAHICNNTQSALTRIEVILNALTLLSKELSKKQGLEVLKNNAEVMTVKLTELHDNLKKVQTRTQYYDTHVRPAQKRAGVEQL